ncbi:MAG: glycosyltransferase family 39 protein [Bifidobacteriaceae bacterium]|nr:glycosyltransferase family 39 protein [Bifidobacteriaceae bacterium]
MAISAFCVYYEHLWKYAALGAALVVAAWLACKYLAIPEKVFLPVFVAVALPSKVAVALIVDAYPVKDFKVMFEAAQDVAAGNLSIQENSYFYDWAYQTGFVLYQSVFVRLFGATTAPLQVMNAVFMTGTNLLIYLIAKRLTKSRRAGAFAATAYFFYPAPYVLASVLTNQHVATFLIMAGLYVMIAAGPEKIWPPLVGGALVALSDIMRPIGVVAVVAVCVWLGILVVRRLDVHSLKASWRGYWPPLRGLALFAGVYLCLGLTASSLVAWSGVNEQGLKNNNPAWKFAIGFNQSDYGAYSSEVADQVWGTEGRTARHNLEKRLISESLSEISKHPIRFIARKNYIMWGQQEMYTWSFDEEASLNRDAATNERWVALAEKVVKFDKGYYFLIILLAVAGLVTVMARKSVPPGTTLVALVFSVYFGIHLLIEVSPLYRYFAMPFVFILAAHSISLLPSWNTVKARLPKRRAHVA